MNQTKNRLAPANGLQRQTRAAAGRNGESGSAILVAVLILGVVMAIGLSSSRWAVAAASGQDKRETGQREHELARTAAANVIASIRTDLPAQYDTDLDRARALASQKPLPAFDPSNVASAASRPVVRVNTTTGQVERTSYHVDSCTSLLGQPNDWAAARIPIAEAYASQKGYGADVVNVASLKEVYRPSVSGKESAYALEYWVDARGGSSARVRPNGILLLGPAQFDCGASVIASAQPSTIVRWSGSGSTISATYTNASNIKITDSAGATVVSQTVTNTTSAQTFTYSVTPTATETYKVTVAGSGVCAAESAPVVVTVVDPPCPSINTFSASPNPSVPGAPVVLTWNVTDATQVLLNGSPVAASGSMTVNPSGTTTYTLQATGPNGWCPQAAQVVVTVVPCPSIEYFTASPPSVTFGGQSVLSWNVLNAGAGVTVTLNGSAVAASGTLAVSPSATTTYVLRVSGPGGCPDTQAQATVEYIPPACPEITSFTVAPATLTAGGAVTVQWNVSNPGNIASVRLTGPGVDQNVAASGSITITLPSEGDYTFTLTATPSVPCPPAQATRGVHVDPPIVTGPTCPSISSFDASASCVLPGAPVTLTWSAADADQVTITDSNGATVAANLPLSGSVTVNPSASTVYTLSAGRASCSTATRPVSVQVAGSSPTIQSFSATPSAIRPGDAAVISYSIVGAASATINGSPVDPTSGSFSVSPNVTTDYVLVAQGGGCSPQSSTQTVRVTVQACPQPSIDQFTASPPSVTAGSTSTLLWSVSSLESGATVNISGPGVNVNVGASGSMSVTPPAAPGVYSYVITAVNPCDPSFSVQQTTTVQVTACPPPQIASFTANPPSVTQGAGGFVRLAWQTNDTSGTGVTVSISPGVGGGLPGTGSVDISVPAATTTYTLTATSGCGASAQAQVTVSVNPPSCPTVTDPLPASQIPAGPEFLFVRGHNVTTPCDPRNAVGCGDKSFTNMETAEFAWDTKGADNVTINGVPVPLKGDVGYLEPFVGWHDGTFSERPFGTKTYTFEAWHSSNPSVRDVHTVTVPFHPIEPDGHIVAFVTADSKNHSPGEPVTVTWDAGKVEPPPTFAFNRVGVTVDIPGVASGLPATGSFVITAPASTKDYTLVANYGGRTATVYFTIVVENPASTGAGWGGSGLAYVPGVFIPFHHPVAIKARVLSNGSIHLRHYIAGADFSIPVTGYVGGGGLYPTGGGYTAGGIAEVYKDGVPLIEQLTFGDPPGINNFYMPFPGTGLMANYAPIPGLPVKDEIIPAALIPNPGCGRIDVKYLGFGSSNWMGFITVNSQPNELFDTRTGFRQAGVFSADPAGRYYVVPSWSQNDWDNGDAYR